MNKKTGKTEFSRLNVIKSNTLVNARYKQQYSAKEIKLIAWIVSSATSKNNKIKSLVLSATDFAELLGIKRQAIYRDGKKVATDLLSKSILIEDETGWMACSWFASMSYREGRFFIELSDAILPHIQQLSKNFTQYRLHNIVNLKSKYAIRLYELLCQYMKIGTRTIEYPVLRENLGIRPNELKQFGHFKKRVLEIAQREINTKTDVFFEWELKKTGRSFSHIIFDINSQPLRTSLILNETLKDVTPDETLSTELFRRLLNLGFKEEDVQKLEVDYAPDVLLEKLIYVEDKIKQGCDIKSPPAYLINALVKNFTGLKQEAVKKPKKKPSKIEQELEILNLEINSCRSAIKSVLAKYNEDYKNSEEEKLAALLKKYETISSKINSKEALNISTYL